jgi:hypothetical protein
MINLERLESIAHSVLNGQNTPIGREINTSNIGGVYHVEIKSKAIENLSEIIAAYEDENFTVEKFDVHAEKGQAIVTIYIVD